MKPFRAILIFAALTALFALAPSLFNAVTQPVETRRDFTILARQFSYSPNRIEVNLGDEVHLKLGALDTVHGIYLEGYDLEAEAQPGRLPFKVRRPSTDEPFAQVEEVVFIANRPGKFRYRCSVTCGTLHPFMLGEFVVHPNRSFQAAVGGVFGALLAGFLLMFQASRHPGTGMPAILPTWRLDLLHHRPRLKRLLTSPRLQFPLQLLALAALTLLIFAGFFGSPIGNRNIVITVVWILWWFLLITFMVPFGARLWCMLCPLPFFGEIFQRRKLLGPGPDGVGENHRELHGQGRKWPAGLSNIWLQNLLFLTMCSFSTILVTRPVATSSVLCGLVLTAFLVHVVYRKRSFCRYLCPIGGWLSVYSTAAMLEVRPADSSLCASCREKNCARGTAQGWSCPWNLVPGKLAANNYCGMCLECLKSCRNHNMTIRARPFFSDLEIKGYDQAWMIFIMMTLCLLYTAIFLGPWGTVKGWANVSETGDWPGFFIYVTTMWLSCLVVMPLLWYLAAWSAGRLTGAAGPEVREIFLGYSYMLVPLGLMSWIAFSVPLVMVNYTHITTSLSDPLGWGWNLFGTAGDRWRPLYPEYLHWLQVPLVVTGLWLALNRGFAIARAKFPGGYRALLSLIPFGALTAGLALLMVIMFTA